MTSPEPALRFEDIEPFLDGIECVGFDVFDTLVLRPFMRPTDLFLYLEEKESAPGFHKERMAAERRARKEIRNEIGIDEIYSVMDGRFLHLKEKEIAAECRLSFADPDMKRIYDRIVGLGMKVVFVSDMYLSNGTITEILCKCGYSGHLYVSNEYGMNKHSGELFGAVLDDLGLRPEEVLFIGDNRRSDHRVPLGLGIRSIRYVPAKERYAGSHPKEMSFLRKGCLGSSVIVSMDMLKWLRGPSDEGYWYDIAYRFGGPVSSFFAIFMMSMIDSAVGTILFISRDGYNLQKIYMILSDDPLENHYVYASRLFTIIFGKDSPDNRDGGRCLFEHLSDTEDLREIGLPDGLSRADLFKDPAENPDLAKRLMRRKRERYSEYLLDRVGGGDVLIVDATTKRFSSQNLIQDVLGPERRVVGCYYNILTTEGPEHYAYADRSGKIATWTKINVSEFFLSSPEAPVTDLSPDGSPVFQKDIPEPELFRMKIYGDVTRGELDYAHDLKTVFGKDLPEIDHKALDGWIGVLVRERPYGNEHISDIRWAPDTMHRRYRSLVFGPEEVPYKLMNMLSDLIWRIRSK